MSFRLQDCFDKLKAENKKALIPYITAGDPSFSQSLAIMQTLVNKGANIIELGIPFSDPVADGPVIQAAHERALQRGTSLLQTLNLVYEFRKLDKETPLVLMGYINPIEIMGYEKFAHQAKQVGVDGILIVDLPPEESEEIFPFFSKEGINPIYLASPNTSLDRLKLIQKYCQGYLYYVSLKGVTGSNTIALNEVAAKINQLRSIISLPICVGFGISDKTIAKQVAQIAEGVIIGSAIVKLIEKNLEDAAKMQNEIAEFVHTIYEVL